MKTVLSIDIDMLFPTHRYNRFIDCDVDYKNSWDIVKAKTGTKDYELNIGAYEWLQRVLDYSVDKKTKIVIINEHDEILPLLRERGYNNATCYNFDSHHDITYYGDNSTPNIENWVLYARSEELIKDYTWVHHDGVDMLLDSPFKFTHSSYKDIEPCQFADVDVDMVVICLSKHFTPINYHYLPLEIKAYCWDLQWNTSKK